LLPSYQGPLVATELNVLNRLMVEPRRPYTVVLGGSKVSDKLAVIDNLLDRADTLLIGGGMAYTFLKAQGYDVASSLLEEDQLPVVQDYLQRSADGAAKIVIPTDTVVAEAFRADAQYAVVNVDAMTSGPGGSAALGLDIGPETAKHYATQIEASATVFWNGPMGVFEMENFAAGTRTIAQALTKVKGLSVVGGGDSAAAVRALGFHDDAYGHISTGGGASLEYLEGKTLPGIDALKNALPLRQYLIPTGDFLTAKTDGAYVRTPLIAGSWKMHMDHFQAVSLVQKLSWTLADHDHSFENVDVAIFPPYTDLRSVQTLIMADKLDLSYGAQD